MLLVLYTKRVCLRLITLSRTSMAIYPMTGASSRSYQVLKQDTWSWWIWARRKQSTVLPAQGESYAWVTNFHKRVQRLLNRQGHRLLFLPPYSPDLNPIEKKWAQAKFLSQSWLESNLDKLFHSMGCANFIVEWLYHPLLIRILLSNKTFNCVCKLAFISSTIIQWFL